jgi:hypothetical protein
MANFPVVVDILGGQKVVIICRGVVDSSIVIG